MQAPLSRTYFDLLREQAARQPDGLAVIDGEEQLTYSKLVARAKSVASGLRTLGVRRSDRIALLMNNRHEWLEIVFGGSALGATIVPISTWSKADELKYLLTDSKANILFTIDSFGSQDYVEMLESLVPECKNEPGTWQSSQFPGLRSIIGIGPRQQRGWINYSLFLSSADEYAELPPGDGASAGDDLFILYTSGTSSRPKAVRIVHFAAIENGYNIGERQGLHDGDRVFLTPPLFWYYAAGNAVAASFSHGAALVLQRRFIPSEAIAILERHSCTAIYTLPNITRQIVHHPDFDKSRTSSLRTGLTIGTPDDVRLAAEMLAAPSICNVYGLTETYGNCCVSWSESPLDERMKGQGPALPGFSLRIVDQATGEPVDLYVIGEVEVRGYVSPGYTGESGEIYNSSTRTSDGYFRTGDLGYFDDERVFHFVGRNNEMIKTGGINVSPAEIEGALQEHPAIAEVVVVGIASAERGEDIVAFIVLRQKNPDLSEDDFRFFCRDRLSSYKVPRYFVVMDSLPTTSTGKISRRALALRWMSDCAKDSIGRSSAAG